MSYELNFLQSLVLTFCIEMPLLWLMLRFVFKTSRDTTSLATILFAGFVATFATLPYVWFVFPAFIHTYIVYTIIVELFAFAVESVIYFFVLRVSVPRALILSLVCNAVSFAAGEAIKAIAPRY